MLSYTQRIDNLLKRFVGKDDVLFDDYRQIDIATEKENLDFQKLRGSVRLLGKRVKTEKELENNFKKIIETPLP